MSPQEIGAEFDKWVDIFLDHMEQPEKLYQEYKRHMVAMEYFLKPIIKKAIKESETKIPVGLLRDTMAKLGQLRKDLAKYSSKSANEGKLRKMIIDLGSLLSKLKNQFEKI